MEVGPATETFVLELRCLEDGRPGPDTLSGGSGGSESQEEEEPQEGSCSPQRPAVLAPVGASEIAEETQPGQQELQLQQLEQQPKPQQQPQQEQLQQPQPHLELQQQPQEDGQQQLSQLQQEKHHSTHHQELNLNCS